MPLSDTQKAGIKKILRSYERTVREITNKHKQQIKKLIGDIDTKKAQGIKKKIEQS